MRAAKILIIILLFANKLQAQVPVVPDNTTKVNQKGAPLQNSFTMYVRCISDVNGNKRVDETLLGDFRILNWLKLQAGFRFGERPQHLNSYYYYKMELSTKFFRNRIRGLVRVSDNVIYYFPPPYRQTNELAIVEYKQPLSRSLQFRGGIGYLLSWKRNNEPEALPANSGLRTNFPVFRLSLLYTTTNKYLYEIAYGSYDVFNPYSYNQPFAQVSAEKEFAERYTIFSYFRYQYNYNVLRPLNYFLCLGLRLNLDKK